MARKYAFITRDIVTTRRKKTLPGNREPINSEEMTWGDLQELVSALLKSDDEVHDDRVCGKGCKGNRDIDEGHCGGFDERVVHRCLPMT